MSSPIRTAVVVWAGLLVLSIFEISQPDLRFWSIPAFSESAIEIARLPEAVWQPLVVVGLLALGGYTAFLRRPRFARR